MGKPLPLETRRAIVRMVRRTECSQAEIARIFKIGHRSVQRYWSLFCQTGDVDSHAKFGGHKKAILAPHEETIADVLSKKPDITLEEIKEQLAQQNILIGRTALFDFIKALGYTNKKNGIWSRAKAQGRSRAKRSVQKAAKRA